MSNRVKPELGECTLHGPLGDHSVLHGLVATKPIPLQVKELGLNHLAIQFPHGTPNDKQKPHLRPKPAWISSLLTMKNRFA